MDERRDIGAVVNEFAERARIELLCYSVFRAVAIGALAYGGMIAEPPDSELLASLVRLTMLVAVFLGLLSVVLNVGDMIVERKWTTRHIRFVVVRPTEQKLYVVPNTGASVIEFSFDQNTRWLILGLRYLVFQPSLVRVLTLSGDRPMAVLWTADLGTQGRTDPAPTWSASPNGGCFSFEFAWFNYTQAIKLGLNDAQLDNAIADAVVTSPDQGGEVTISAGPAVIGAGRVVNTML